MSNLEQFIIKSFTTPNWLLYLIAISIPIIILIIIFEIFKIDKISEEKPKINTLFNVLCIVLPFFTEGDGKILLKYDLKENETFLSDNRTIIIRKEKIDNNEKYYAKISSKEMETTLDEIKDVVRKSKNVKTEDKLTLKDLGKNND